MGRVLFAVAMLAAGCGVQLADQSGGGGGGGGGGTSDGGPDSGGNVTIDAPACFNGRVVYLNFDGVALTQGPSDATLNRAAWMQTATGTAPPYRNGQTNRNSDIMQITNGIKQQLASFPVTVVTQRPASGPYVMIVFGGTAQNVGSRFGGAVNQLDCGDIAKSDVAWISDSVSPTQRIVNYAVGAIGFGLGLTATTTPTDCMCGWDNQCTSDNSVACTLSTNIARDPAANQRCPNLTTQNEQQTFFQAFCQ